MQDIQFRAPTQTMPSVELLEQGIRIRLEHFSFSVHLPLEQYRQAGHHFNGHSTSAIITQLELAQIELNHLINELQWLDWIKTSLKGK